MSNSFLVLVQTGFAILGQWIEGRAWSGRGLPLGYGSVLPQDAGPLAMGSRRHAFVA